MIFNIQYPCLYNDDRRSHKGNRRALKRKEATDASLGGEEAANNRKEIDGGKKKKKKKKNLWILVFREQ